MTIIIQCAGYKKNDASSLCLNGNPVAFVAQAGGVGGRAAPWDAIPGMLGATWIDYVNAMNAPHDVQPLPVVDAAQIGAHNAGHQLYQCGNLYAHHAYADLIRRFGVRGQRRLRPFCWVGARACRLAAADVQRQVVD